MLYIERQPSRRSVFLLALLVPVLYLVSLCLLEMRACDEGYQSAMAMDMIYGGSLGKTHLYGRPISEYPLYSWLVCLFSGFGTPTIVTLRLPALLSVLGLGVMSGLCAMKLQSKFAGFIAASVVTLSVLGFQTGIRAQTETLQALLLFGAWWSWFHFGVECRRWSLAWGVSLGLVFLGVLNDGLESAFWFYLPMFFMPHQINARMRMQMPVHIVCLLSAAFLLFVWLWLTPGQPLVPWNREITYTVHEGSGYIGHFFGFPFKCVYYLLPWGVLLWAPFCIALRPFERSQTAAMFFRIIVFVVFLVVWFFPDSSPLQALPALGPMAVLIGIHFEIVLRRHQRVMRIAALATGWTVLVLGGLVSLFWLGIVFGLIEMEGMLYLGALCYALLMLVMCGCVWALVLRKNCRCTFRSSIIWCIGGVCVLAQCSWMAYSNWLAAHKRLAGQYLAGTVWPGELTDAVLTAGAGDAFERVVQLGSFQDVAENVDKIYYRLPNETFTAKYLVELRELKRPIIQLKPRGDWEKDLPATEKTVYVLSAKLPALASRSWRALSPAVELGGQYAGKLTWNGWGKGEPWIKLRRSRIDDGGARQGMQLFEGVLLDRNKLANHQETNQGKQP